MEAGWASLGETGHFGRGSTARTTTGWVSEVTETDLFQCCIILQSLRGADSTRCESGMGGKRGEEGLHLERWAQGVVLPRLGYL
jgi:hypothetical protein